VVHYPCYQSLREVAASRGEIYPPPLASLPFACSNYFLREINIGCNVIRWETTPENGWALDMKFLRKTLTEHNSPENKVVVFFLILACSVPHEPNVYT